MKFEEVKKMAQELGYEVEVKEDIAYDYAVDEDGEYTDKLIGTELLGYEVMFGEEFGKSWYFYFEDLDGESVDEEYEDYEEEMGDDL